MEHTLHWSIELYDNSYLSWDYIDISALFLICDTFVQAAAFSEMPYNSSCSYNGSVSASSASVKPFVQFVPPLNSATSPRLLHVFELSQAIHYPTTIGNIRALSSSTYVYVLPGQSHCSQIHAFLLPSAMANADVHASGLSAWLARGATISVQL